MRYKNLFDLKGKVAVVTGSSGLIGKAIVQALSEFGAKVICADIDNSKQKRSGNLISYYLDITRESSTKELLHFVDTKFRHLDIWINCAYPRVKDWGKEKASDREFFLKKNIEMHLSGYCYTSLQAAEYMKQNGKGSIINFASIYGLLGPDLNLYKDTPVTPVPVAYSAIKGGIISFTRHLASTYGKFNIRANCISPGGVFNHQAKKFVTRYNQKTLLGRMAEPCDLTGAAVYLASNASSYITGQNIVVDGGYSSI